MIIKSFTAESAATALRKVREGLGGDAIVLKTTRVPGPGTSTLVEITACLEKPSVGQASTALSSGTTDRVQSPIPESFNSDVPSTPTSSFEREINLPDDRLTKLEAKLDQLIGRPAISEKTHLPNPHLQSIADLLEVADMPKDFINELLSNEALTTIGEENMLQAVRQMMVNRFAAMMEPSLTLTKNDRVIFIGPPGVGKSSVMGKLATQLVVKEKKKVTLAGVEFQKVGAHDELTGYADLLNIPVIDNLLDTKKSKTIQLIDCPSLPYEKEAAARLICAIEKAQTTYRIVVLSSLMHLDDVALATEHLNKLNPTHVVITMCDLTQRRGNIIAATKACNAKLLFLSDSVGGMGTLKTPDPDLLARQILKMESGRE